MATKTASVKAKPEARAEGVDKSEFIRGGLSKKPKAMFRHVLEAWTVAGNKDLLTTSLFYLVKSKAKKPSCRRGRPKLDRGGADGVGVSPRDEANAVYVQIESELDKLISLAPDAEIAEAPRAARRRVSARLVICTAI